MYIAFAIVIIGVVLIGVVFKDLVHILEVIAGETYRHLKFIFRPKARKHIRSIKKKLVTYCRKNGLKICIWPIYPFPRKDELATGTAPKFLHMVTYSSMWMEKLADGDSLWQIAFEQSVGHEIGHRYDLSKRNFCKDVEDDKKNFFNWVQECRCDFYGICFLNALYSKQISRDYIIRAFENKMKVYQPVEEDRAQSCLTHPSWNFRYKMVKKYQEFNADVIHEIAIEAGMIDERYEKRLAGLSVIDKQADKLLDFKDS